ncbi:Rieske 2Fe-2S domain-containing protein [Streptomyces sp. NPDC048106]|uniref:Rieske 2Fe-2S domain-containing protein n=1 Tax=Streptomyces sp. NPDC048106 TaxID=3155750 RepID=UPI003454B0A1
MTWQTQRAQPHEPGRSPGHVPQPAGPAGAGPPLPYPAGWFLLARSRDLAAKAVITRRFAGEDVVLYRTRAGAAHAVRPYCPHLGAHFGRGGTVEGDNLVCPFHRFAFAPDGTCVRTPEGPPPRARAEPYSVRERNGMIFAWHGHDSTPPAWELPEEPGPDVTPAAWWSTDVLTHPQEVIENITDYRHAATLHRVPTEETAPLETDGPLLRLSLRSGLDHVPVLGTLSGDQAVLLAGLGLLYSRVDMPRFGLRFHLWSLPTPIAPWTSRLRFASACTITDPARRPALRRRASQHALTTVLARGVGKAAVRVLKQDITIWNHKRYEPHPRLAAGDEAIGHYRHWARQFYPTTY